MIMKKQQVQFAILITFLLLIAVGCSNDEDRVEDKEENTTATETTQAEETEDEAIHVNQESTTVEITLPETFFESEEEVNHAIAQVEDEDGFTDIIKNENGSVTYNMTPSKHEEMMEEIESDINQTMEEIVQDEELSSIHEVTVDNSFSTFEVVVDQVVYENSFDGMATFSLGLSGLLYQLFDGVSPDEYEVLIHLEDHNTGDVFSTLKYPEVLEEIE